MYPNGRGKRLVNMSAWRETFRVELLKVGEGLTANTEPSLRNQEGVETWRAAPKAKAMVKVKSRPQTKRVAKAIVVRKSLQCWFESSHAHLQFYLLLKE